MKSVISNIKFRGAMFLSSLSVLSLIIITAFFLFRSNNGIVSGQEIVKKLQTPACKLYETGATNTISERVVVVGDVHGSFDGLLEILNAANITTSSTECKWKENVSIPTLFVQVGDIVDRGAGATEAWLCLQYLQNTSRNNNDRSKVIRLLGSK